VGGEGTGGNEEEGGRGEGDVGGHVLLLSQGADSVALNMVTFWREAEQTKKE